MESPERTRTFKLSSRENQDIPLALAARHQWHDFALFALRFLSDLGKSSVILIGFVFFGWLLHLSRIGGLADNYASALELVHFCAYYAVFLLICIDFVYRLAITVFKGDQR
jgi:hypothetical protein